MLLSELFIPKRYQEPDPVGRIAKKHGVSRKQIAHQLKMGIKVEREHKDDDVVARQIALDHLEEVPDYYDKLKTVESD